MTVVEARSFVWSALQVGALAGAPPTSMSVPSSIGREGNPAPPAALPALDSLSVLDPAELSPETLAPPLLGCPLRSLPPHCVKASASNGRLKRSAKPSKAPASNLRDG